MNEFIKKVKETDVSSERGLGVDRIVIYECGNYRVKEEVYKSGYKSYGVYVNDVTRKYQPEIFYHDEFFSGKGRGDFCVATASYGSLDIEEMAEFMEAMADGYNTAVSLNYAFCKEDE